MNTPMKKTTRAAPPRFSLRGYTNLPLELFITVFSALPFILLVSLYPMLPERVPLFLDVLGRVSVWGYKSLFTVFRLPLMALVLQALCLLMKFGSLVQAATPKHEETYGHPEQKLLIATARLWDWFRILIAFKVSASAPVIAFSSIPQLHALAEPAFILTSSVALVAVVGALIHLYRIFALGRAQAQQHASRVTCSPDANRVYWGVIYVNPDDPGLFAGRYLLNFGNGWAYALLACLVAYPLLVFAPL